MNRQLNILLISSISPYSSARLGYDIIQSLENNGHCVRTITKYKEKQNSIKLHSVLDSEMPTSLIESIKKKIHY